MAEKQDNNDEYEFPELNDFTTDQYETDTPDVDAFDNISTTDSQSSSSFSMSNLNPVWRNGIILIIGVVVLMLAYKYFGSWFTSSDDSQSQISSISPAKKQPIKQPPVQEPPKQVVQPKLPPAKKEDDGAKQFRQKLARLEISQQNMNANVSEIESKLNGLDGNVTNLADKLSDINNQLNHIADKLDSQASMINGMRARMTRKKVARPKKVGPPPIQYAIQAVIPGRAWLIGSNGSTITVSKGSRIASYGKVRLIDAQLGRVVTSSGKVIEFEQENF